MRRKYILEEFYDSDYSYYSAGVVSIGYGASDKVIGYLLRDSGVGVVVRGNGCIGADKAGGGR